MAKKLLTGAYRGIKTKKQNLPVNLEDILGHMLLTFLQANQREEVTLEGGRDFCKPDGVVGHVLMVGLVIEVMLTAGIVLVQVKR